MELKFSRNEDDKEIVVKIKDEKEEFDFDYIKFIEYIYNNPEKDITSSFDENIDQEQKEIIYKMLDDISSIMSGNRD